MTTGHISESAIDYWTGQLEPGARAAVDAHLRNCADCRSEFDAVRLALDAVSGWPNEPKLDDVAVDRIARAARRAPRRPQWWQAAAVLLFGVVCGVAGYAGGRRESDAARLPVAAGDSSRGMYLLLLEEYAWPPPAALSQARDGYGAWARSLRAAHRYVDAQKLSEESGFRVEPNGDVVRPEASRRPPSMSGFFLISAASYDDAIAWVRRGPHLRYGSVLVRRIE